MARGISTEGLISDGKDSQSIEQNVKGLIDAADWSNTADEHDQTATTQINRDKGHWPEDGVTCCIRCGQFVVQVFDAKCYNQIFILV